MVDTEQIVKDFNQEDHQNFPGEIPAKKVFINAQKISETGNLWTYNEGCLSIPKIREDINRTEKVRIRYQDENFNTHEEDFFGLCGRVILHEYDHIEGKLFIDYLPQIKKRLIKKKLDDISSGKTKSDYKMIHHK